MYKSLIIFQQEDLSAKMYVTYDSFLSILF